MLIKIIKSGEYKIQCDNCLCRFINKDLKQFCDNCEKILNDLKEIDIQLEVIEVTQKKSSKKFKNKI